MEEALLLNFTNTNELQVNEQLYTLITQQALRIMQLEESLNKNVVKQEIPINDFLYLWLSKQNHLAPNTRDTYNGLLKNHFQKYFEKEDLLHEITSKNIEDFYLYKARMGYNPNTIIRLHSFLFTAFKEAVKQEYIFRNPMEKVQRPKAHKYIANWYDEHQLHTLLKKTKKHSLFIAIVLAAFLGLRRSEIVGLKWENINLSRRTVSIREKTIHRNKEDYDIKKLKNVSSNRTLILPDSMYMFLVKLKKLQNNLMVTGGFEQNSSYKYVCLDMNSFDGKRITLNQITHGFRKLIEELNLPKIRFHDLRHSCATYLLHSGCTMLQVQQWLGHSDYKTTVDYYAHTDITDKQRVAAALEETFKFF